MTKFDLKIYIACFSAISIGLAIVIPIFMIGPTVVWFPYGVLFLLGLSSISIGTQVAGRFLLGI